MLGKFPLLVNASLPESGGDDADMAKSSREILAANLAALRDAEPGKLSQAELGKRGSVDQTTAGRILQAKNAMRLDGLDTFAKGFRLSPWQLLVPDLDPKKPPQIAHFSARAVEVARLYDELPPAKQRLLYAQAQVLHNPDAEPDLSPGSPA